jgi:hypothetical protein
MVTPLRMAADVVLCLLSVGGASARARDRLGGDRRRDGGIEMWY